MVQPAPNKTNKEKSRKREAETLWEERGVSHRVATEAPGQGGPGPSSTLSQTGAAWAAGALPRWEAHEAGGRYCAAAASKLPTEMMGSLFGPRLTPCLQHPCGHSVLGHLVPSLPTRGQHSPDEAADGHRVPRVHHVAQCQPAGPVFRHLARNTSSLSQQLQGSPEPWALALRRPGPAGHLRAPPPREADGPPAGWGLWPRAVGLAGCER